MNKPCAHCRNWNDCNGKDFYSIPEIRYCRYQVLWIIKNLIACVASELMAMRETWPIEEIETGYTEAPLTSHSISSHAPFERTLQIVGDVTGRLKRTGKDGRLLVLEVHNDAPLSQDARNALNYVSGWKERQQGYRQWLKQRKYKSHLTVRAITMEQLK